MHWSSIFFSIPFIIIGAFEVYAISQTNFILLEATLSGAFCDPPFSRFYFWTCHSTFWLRWQSSQKVIVQSLVGNDYYYFHQAYHIYFYHGKCYTVILGWKYVYQLVVVVVPLLQELGFFLQHDISRTIQAHGKYMTSKDCTITFWLDCQRSQKVEWQVQK